MRLASGCLSCAMALVAQGTYGQDLKTEQKTRKWLPSYTDHLIGRPLLIGQPSLQEEPIQDIPEFTVTRIFETTVTESQPRVTDAPIFKRKLGSHKWDIVHNRIQGQKRDATSCPSDYQLCPQSMDGGCCPSDRVCGTSSCFATTSAPASACGSVGYIACGIDQGGGCCPSNYVCDTYGCSPSAGVSDTQTCGPSSYLCPASLNYGCCQNGLACGLANCYSTSVQTFTELETFTTTDDGHTETIISTILNEITPTIPVAATSVPSSTGENVVPKVTSVASAILKTAATSTGGLTKPQIDGIIAGAVILLVVILVLAFVIVFRLNKVKQTVESSYRSGTRSGHSKKKPPKAPTTMDMETISVDPFMMTPSEADKSVRHPSQPNPIHNTAHEVDASPALTSHPFNPTAPLSPPHHSYARGYAPVATSEPPSPPYQNRPGDSPSGHGRTPSDAAPVADLRDQNLRFGHIGPLSPPPASKRQSMHERQWSGGSNTSKFSQGSSTMSELDGSGSGESSMIRAIHGLSWILNPRRGAENGKWTSGSASRES